MLPWYSSLDLIDVQHKLSSLADVLVPDTVVKKGTDAAGAFASDIEQIRLDYKLRTA